MILSDQKIQHVSTITHDGKVVCFGTGLDGTLWYTVKRSGFEDTALNDDTDPFGFEGLKKLRLGESIPDPSVIESEKKTLADNDGNVLVKSVYGGSDEVVKSVDAPVQVVSALNQLFVFRQSPGGKILVNRFVLDGMTNELVPRLEVRFRRSRQRLKPQESATSKDGGSFDNLDYRDIDGNYFYEGALELGFAGTVVSGWFSPVFVPTAESDRNRWHLFVHDAKESKLVLYTVGSGDNGLFDVKDYLYARRDPSNAKNTIYQSVPGIVRRTIDLKGLTVAGGPSATTYDLQKEVMTDAGPQLMRDTMRVMLAVPVKATDSEVVKTAVLDFALAADGTLSQIDHTPDQSKILRTNEREVVTPLSLLDGIKEFADESPPPSGTIVATERGGDDKLQIRSKDSLPADLKTGAKVKIRGTRSYDGHYMVLSVDGATFQVEAKFENDEAGFWEVAEDKQTGLVFDNMVVGAEKTEDGKLMIVCPWHDLKVGHEVQISGTQTYDGIFPITSLVASKRAFVLNAPYFTGEAANLSKVVRRGLRMDGNDCVETPDLELAPPSPERHLGRTFSAWVRVDAAGNLEQSLVKDSGGMMNLALGADNKAKLVVRMSDGGARTVTDPSAMPVGAWVHYAGTVDYVTKTGGDTRIALCRDGVEVAQQVIAHGVPCHLNDKVLQFDGVDDQVAIKDSPPDVANKSFSVEFWAKRDRINSLEYVIAQGTPAANTCLHVGFRPNNTFTFSFWGNGADTKLAYTDLEWHHWACTYDATTHTQHVYRDGALVLENVTTAHFQGSGTWTIGQFSDGNFHLKGSIADVRIWSRARTKVEIAEDMARRLTGREAGLLGYWPLDDGTTKDLSPAKRHGALKGDLAWTKAAYLHPQSVLPASPGTKLAKAMKFDGAADFVEVASGAPLFTGSFTVAAWVKLTGGKGRYRSPLTCRGGDCTGLAIYATDSNIWQCRVGSGSAWTYIQGPAVVEGVWTHIALTFDGTKWNFYVNGSAPVSSTAAYKSSTQPMRIGAGNTEGNPDFYFHGCIADMEIWSLARSKADIQADMSRKPTGKESDLAGYWSLDADASDLSANKRGSLLKGNPALVSAASTHTIGQAFSGEISGVQIWDEARSAADVKATMHVNLSGKENGLAAYYRMGAVVYEEQPPIVPDFSHHGRNAVVYGDPYAGARSLDRATGSDEDKKKVVKYGSEELLAVSQRGVYEESFEFKVNSPGAAVDPSDADGTGRKLFTFSYWGKSSRGSKERIEFPAGSVQQFDFESAAPGWYKAKCRVVVPDGVSLMRAFEISDVRGKWGAESSAPAAEWTSIDVRKHRIRLVSDSVTRDQYTDATALSSLPAQAQAVLDSLTTMGRAEAKVGRVEGQIRDLTERIDVAKNYQRYVDEKNALTTTVSSLSSQKTKAQNECKAIEDNRWSYYQRVLNLNSGKDMTGGDDKVVLQYGPWATNDLNYQRWRFEERADGYFHILHQRSGLSLSVPGAGGKDADLRLEPLGGVSHMQWKLSCLDSSKSHYTLKPRHNENVYVEVAWGDTWDSAALQLWDWSGANHQKWHVLKTSDVTKEAKSDLDAKNATVARLQSEIQSKQARIDELNELLAAKEDVTALQNQLTAARTDLDASRKDLATKNTAVIDGLEKAKPAIMPTIATDERHLVTAGAVLDFAQPTGRVRLAESCEGNVLLTYFDPQGRMRATAYDAASDSRNATFEQWLPDAVRASADIRDSGDKVTLEKVVSLPASGWTCEAWVQYPLATRGTKSDGTADGTAYESNVVASSDTSLDVPLMVRKGSRLGLMVNGWFFDSGADLRRTLAAGWHHVAVATRKGTTSFYADGEKIGSRDTSQPAIRLKGTADYVEVPAHTNPTTAITVSIWARSTTSNWNGAGCLVSKRDAFIMSPVKDSKMIQFYVYVTGQGWKSASFTPADIQGWHLYTGTFDGSYVCLYVDGELAATLGVTGAIQAASGVMHIGYDKDNNAYFNGDIAEVSIWKSARSFVDVRDDIYRSFTGDEADLVGYWRMDDVEEGGVLKVKDLTSNKRDGLLKGAPADATITTMRAIDKDSDDENENDIKIKFLGNASKGGSPIGRLAEVRLWNLGLTDAEVAAHARASISGNEPGLVGYWPFDEATGATARDRSAGGLAHGSMVGVEWMGCTANLGNPGSKVLSLPDRGKTYVQCPAVTPATTSFTFECWARRSGADAGQFQIIAATPGQSGTGAFAFGFSNASKIMVSFNGTAVTSASDYKDDTDWHHVCFTHDQLTKTLRIYCDGVKVGEQTATGDLVVSGALSIGKAHTGEYYFRGDLAEVRLWDRARTEAEIRANMRRRLVGTEPNLLAYYPLDEVNGDKKVKDKKTGAFQGQLTGSVTVLLTTSLPAAGAESLITTEYSSIEVSGEGKKQALMRRFFGFTTGGYVQLLPEQRVEQLALQWVGNTQINPTLLGYIEGAPPVPSENLTVDEDYNGATAVTLSQSDETSYSWQRSETTHGGLSMDGFLGAAWGVEAGPAFVTSEVSEGQAGAVFNYAFEKTDTKDSSVTAASTLATSDSLELSGMAEDTASCPLLGKRWVPKNVGYALVISGMADVFVTKLKRSGRMVSYDIRPVEGVPLDVNTITFLINPTYTLNGSLDGMVGSMPADPTFYPHVPDMRSQYGSLYPASYFRLKEAYALKDAIERHDKERESFFYNFSADQVEKLDSFSDPSAPSVAEGGTPVSSKATEADLDAMMEQNEEKKKELKSEGEKRKAEIKGKYKNLEGRVRAGAAFADWQLRMEGIQTKAGKRNVVNTYVWDGDGGLRAEAQSFASTIEHSISTEMSHSGGIGGNADAAVAGFKFSLSLVGSGGKVDANSKRLSTSKSLELSVDLSGVEKRGLTDPQDNPLVPGEKVDRYRFMTFYLEGSTDHFSDFFSYVVDPVWLMSNDEEARALRQASAAKPNKCWRVLHRVTYVERPVLMGFGRDMRVLPLGDADEVVTDYFADLERKQQALDVRLGGIEDKLAEIISKLSE
ncbi:LamG-like jellyroll fold domain-containing protein [Sorangium sp. So ce363]|uniref:LamG-like jellyroll fold domain-containing protein n=1 Tax=Sorangium sp. So ce363 TaxID=3133304 RepID=UPI003F5E0CC1